MKEKIYYAAYGNTLDPFTMLKICPNAVIAGVGEILDCKLMFRGEENNGRATIEPTQGKSVPVTVWEIGNSDESDLDNYINFPAFNNKKMIEIEMFSNAKELYTSPGEGKRVTAIIYFMNGRHRINLPSSDYLNTILDGYDESGLDPTAIEKALEMANRHAGKWLYG